MRKHLYQCPSRDDKSDGPDGLPRSYAANYTGNYSGSYTDQGDGAFAGAGSKALNLAEIPDAKNLIGLCEVSRHSTPDFNIDNIAPFNPHNSTLWAGHTSGSNYLLMDGHVKWLKPLDTKDLWHRDTAIPLTPAAIAILADAQKRAGK
jgi:prepilin-type processing-associated H-X9-DG protein